MSCGDNCGRRGTIYRAHGEGTAVGRTEVVRHRIRKNVDQPEIEIKQNVLLAALTTMRVGGLADQFATVNETHQLIKLVRWARANSIPYLLLGGGSNVLISDQGVRGLVIHNRCRQVRVDQLLYCEIDRGKEAFLFVESGAATAGAARISIREGLTGFEWAVSVPGTIGGAVVNNAGAHGGAVQDNLENVLVLAADSQDETGKTISGDVVDYQLVDLAYGYRESALKHKPNRKKVSEQLAINSEQTTSERVRPAIRKAGFDAVVLSANFRLRYSNDGVRSKNAEEPQTSPKAMADKFLAHRRSTQPSEPSLGSMFMNPPDSYAGSLIESAGLKGLRIGGAQISPLHANFMINKGVATASDILSLVEHVQMQVAEQSGINLVPEIQLVGEWD